jgi:hypothetical protein
MPAFILDGEIYGFLSPDPGHLETTRSWEDEKRPKVIATLALVGGGTLDVHARAERRKAAYIRVVWEDDSYNRHRAWVPAGGVRTLTDSEWDIWEYQRCPPELRSVRWKDRIPGFLPPEA